MKLSRRFCWTSGPRLPGSVRCTATRPITPLTVTMGLKKEKQIQLNQESYNKYMYALKLREEAAKHIGIENIRRSRLAKLAREKASIEAEYKKGSQIYPDFRLMILVRLEA